MLVYQREMPKPGFQQVEGDSMAILLEVCDCVILLRLEIVATTTLGFGHPGLQA